MSEKESWAYIGPLKIGPQGRITIPKRWREQLNLEPVDTIHVKIVKEEA